MKRFIGIQKVLILFLICVAGCNKEKIIINQPSWKQHPKIELNAKVKFNSFSSNDELYLYGPYYFSVIDKKGKINNYLTALDYPYGKKLAITSLTFYKGSQLFTAKFENANYSVRELKNDGLEGNQITSITQFNDSIYMTSYSGVFYKSKSQFFQSKR